MADALPPGEAQQAHRDLVFDAADYREELSFREAYARYEGAVTQSVVMGIGLVYLMVPMLITAWLPNIPGEEYNATRIDTLNRLGWSCVTGLQMALFYVHTALLMASTRIVRFWHRFDDAVLQQLCLVDQLVVLQFAGWFMICIDELGRYGNAMGYLLLVLSHARFIDLARHCLWDQKTFLPLVVHYPYLSHKLSHQDRRAVAHEHDE